MKSSKKRLTFDGQFTLRVDAAELVGRLTAISAGVVDSAVSNAKCSNILSIGQVIFLALVQLLVVLKPVNRRRRLAAGYFALQRCLLLSLGRFVSQRFDHFWSCAT